MYEQSKLFEFIHAERRDEIAAYLTKHNMPEEGLESLFIHSVVKNWPELVKLCVDNGVDIRQKDDVAICTAAKKGHLESVQVLHENGASLHANGGRAFWQAVRKNNIDVVKYGLEQGVDILARKGGTLLEAMGSCNNDMREMLLSYALFNRICEKPGDVVGLPILDGKSFVELQSRTVPVSRTYALPEFMRIRMHAPENVTLSPLLIYGLYGEMGRIMEMNATRGKDEISPKFLKRCEFHGITNAEILHKCGQLETIFDQRYWVNRPLKSHDRIEALYDALPDNEREAIKATYHNTMNQLKMKKIRSNLKGRKIIRRGPK